MVINQGISLLLICELLGLMYPNCSLNALSTDHLKTHTAEGSLLVRSMFSELAEQLSLVYTPADDPDATRIEWLWRISRRIVTHNHHRRDFETLLTDARTHFETLTHTPDDLLRHIGSPFAPDNRPPQSQTLAA